MAIYVTLASLPVFGLPDSVLSDIPTVVQQRALDYANARIDDAIVASIPLPLTLTPLSLERDGAVIASYELLRVRGLNPEGNDKFLVDEYERTIKRLEEIGKRQKALVTDAVNPAQPLRAIVTVPPSAYVGISDGDLISGF